MAATHQLREQLQHRIREEREREEGLTDEQLAAQLRSGDLDRVRAALIYFTRPEVLPARLAHDLREVERCAGSAAPGRKVQLLGWLTRLAIDLGSAAPAWGRLRDLSPAALDELSARVVEAVEAFAGREPDVGETLLARLRAEAAARARAEGVAGEAAVADVVEDAVGGSPAEHARRTLRAVQRSALRAAGAAFQEGTVETVFGNDYAEFLPHVVWLGGAFATTNPVLVKLAWDLDPGLWSGRVDEVVRARPDAGKGLDDTADSTVDGLTAEVTVAVAERSCKELRPIFLSTGGAHGYVSVQVDPTAHGDPSRMVVAARAIHGELARRLEGVPNAVVKVPATAAGLEAARELTARGIGVTATLTFSLFQALPFGRVLAAGQAPVSCIAIMNGRLAFPVRDELVGMGIPGGAQAARWAGVEVARKACRRLYAQEAEGGMGVDPARVKVMIASLRVYDEWVPDLTELWGVPLVTLFPNVRRAYDGAPRPAPAPALSAPTPARELEVLLRSEIFRQAWWTEADGGRGRPERALSLDPADGEAVARWAPVGETLAQFIGTFEEMRGMVRARLEAAR
jgi:transaldolase